MKIPERKISGLFPDKHNVYVLLENKLIIVGVLSEEIAIWGFLLYSREVSERISRDLIYNNKISEN